MDDYVDPDFHARRNAGEVFNNDCTFTVVKKYYSETEGRNTHWITATPQNKYIMTSGNQTDWCLQKKVSYYQYNECTAPDYFVDAGQLAKQKCLAHVDSTPYEFFEDLAEIGETLRFLKNPVNSLENLLRAYAKKKRKLDRITDVKQKAKALADLWNQYRFAAAPLARSLMTIAEIADSKADSIVRPRRRTAHGFGENSTEKVESFEPWMSFGPGDAIVFHYDKASRREIQAHASIYYEVSNPLVDWRFKLGLRLKDVPVVLWEVFPLSFLYDRLFDIKSMISGLLNLSDPAVTFLASSVTTKEWKYVQNTMSNFWSSYGTLTTDVHSVDSVFNEEFSYRRRTWQPSVFDTIPQLTPGNLVSDLTKILDLIAIITSRAL
jgi:hypothetical protein